MTRTLVVVNPASAGGRTGHRWPDSESLLRALGVDFDVHVTSAPDDATRAVRRALRDGATRIVAVGGDGTLNEVVNGFFAEDGTPIGSAATLGLVPSGTGGDFRKTAGIPAAPDAAVKVLAEARPRSVDAGRIDFADGSHRFFINIADCGIGGEVVARVNRSRYKGGGVRGSAVFLRESIATLLTFGGRPVRVTIDDGEPIERKVQSVVVANGQYFGGGMHVAPGARIDDGSFDVVIVEAMSRTRAVTSMPSLYRGTHVRRPGVEVRRGTRVVIVSLDEPLLFDVEGEQVGRTPATITCLPHAIALYVPATSGAP